MQCVHCERDVKTLKARNLCWGCYRYDDIRERYPVVDHPPKPLDPGRPACKHCKERNGIKYRCGLCKRCYGCIDIRVKYRVQRNYKGSNGGGDGVYRGPSMEELEALIAERSQNLPRWWHREPKVPCLSSEPLAVRRMIRTGRAGMMVRKISNEW